MPTDHMFHPRNDDAKNTPPVPDDLVADAEPDVADTEPTEAADHAVADASEPAEKVTDTPAEKAAPTKGGKLAGVKRVLRGYWHHKLWTVPLTVVVLLAILLAIPFTRYHALAFFLKRDVAVTVTDSTTGTPVSGASVTLDGVKKTTNSSGKAMLTVPVGDGTLVVAKTYYKSGSKAVLVEITGSNVVAIRLVATGRQVPIKVVNKITGAPIAAATLTVGSTNAKTDDNGMATIVLPASDATQKGILTANEFNNLSVTVQVTTRSVPENTFSVTPSGKIYFLSNLSGKIDVVSTNLDGTNRNTVLAGTGKEDTATTSLLASRDWHYLVLDSSRDGSNKLYLINSNNDPVTTLSDDDATYSPVGWSDHYFVYSEAPANHGSWQPGGTLLKSYNADTGKTITLATSDATGTNAIDAQYQSIWSTIFIGDHLVYSTTWYRAPGYLTVSGQQDTLVSIKPDGSASKTLKSVDAGQYYITSLTLATPDTAYFAVQDNNYTNTNYYRLDSSGSISQSSTITSDSVNTRYPTYLVSPSGKSTFWTNLRDGKNTLLVGDYEGDNGTTVATLSDYSPYGWFTDDYLLVQKGGSELYIMPAAGGTALKISDYYKPFSTFYGYGGGYGGL